MVFKLKRCQCRCGCFRVFHRIAVTHLHIEAERLHFLDEHVEGFRDAGLQRVVALDDAFVDARAALDVIGFQPTGLRL